MNEKKQKKINKVMDSLGGKISNSNDLLGGEEPGLMFFFLINKLGYLLENDPKLVISKKGIELRQKINKLFKMVGPKFLRNPQVIVNRNELLGVPNDESIEIPKDRPIIYVANHKFKDDTLASILAADRNAYILFGSLPQFYNCIDGISSWINGSIMTNRKVHESKKASIAKAEYAIANGANLLVFPEGVWNKSPNKLLLDFWPGVFRIAKDTDALIVPIVHYIDDTSKKGDDNPIFTVVDNPLDISNMTLDEANEKLRESMGTLYFKLMERNGVHKRDEIVREKTSSEYWSDELRKRVATTYRYDMEIESCADYRLKSKPEAIDVFKNISQIENITPENALEVAKAKELIKIEEKNNFQRRF